MKKEEDIPTDAEMVVGIHQLAVAEFKKRICCLKPTERIDFAKAWLAKTRELMQRFPEYDSKE